MNYFRPGRWIFGVLLLMTTPAYAGSGTINYNMSYVSQFGTAGTGPGQFLEPGRMAIDSNNNLLILDSDQNNVQVYTRAGSYLGEFGTPGGGPGQFNDPFGLAINTNGHIIVGDGPQLQIFDSNFNFIGNITSPNGLNGIDGAAFNAAGELYIAEYLTNRLQVFDTNYNYVRTIGTAGTGDGQFDEPSSIAFAPDGRYYVADASNSRIQIFNANDTFAGYLATGGTDPEDVQYPFGITVDQFGNVYVADLAATRIQVFDKNGTLLLTYGSFGTGNGQFREPESTLVTEDGLVYVSDGTNRNVQILSLTSTETFSSSPAGGDETAGMAISFLDLTGTGSFDDDFIGYQSVDVTGNWILNGNNSFVTQANVTSGNLFINGTLTAPDITIDNGATIGGTGSIVGDVVNNGVVSPGDVSIGILTITGDYTSSNTSSYNVDLNDAAQNDRINVSGNAVIDGTLNINAANGGYAANTNYTLLSAVGNLTGAFDTVNNNLAFLSPTLMNDGHNLFLNLYNPNANPTQVNFVPFATNNNQVQVAESLGPYSAIGFNGDATLSNTVLGFSNQEAALFLKEITPDDIATIPMIQMQSLAQIQSPLWQRLASFTALVPVASYGNIPSPGQVDQDTASFAFISPAAEEELTERNIWLETIGGVMNQDSYNGQTGFRSLVTGGRGGIDHVFSDNLLLGMSGAYIQTKTGFDTSNNKAESSYGHLDIYGQKNYSALTLEGFAGIGAGQIETTRFVTAGGLDRTAKGDTPAFDATIAMKASRALPVSERIALIPSMTTTVSWQKQNGFTEEGAGALNMKLEDVTIIPVTVKPMMTVEKNFTSSRQGVNSLVSLGAGVIWQANERQSNVTAGFSQTNIPQFTVQGAKQKPFSANIVAGFTMEPTQASKYVPKTSFTAASQFNNVSTNHTVAMHLTWQW